MSELLPCPFCGGKAIFVVKSNISNHQGVGFDYNIECSSCGCSPTKKNAEMHIFLNKDGEVKITDASIVTRNSMIEAWNTRTPKERGVEK